MAAGVVADTIGDHDLAIRRDTLSTPWLTGLVSATVRRLGLDRHFLDAPDRAG